MIKKNAKISEAIFILLATVSIYLITYCYYCGYISFYGLPNNFFDISLSRIINISYTYWTGLNPGYKMIILFSICIPIDIFVKNKFIGSIKFTFISILLLLISIPIIGINQNLLIFNVPIILVILLEIINPWVIARDKKGFINRINCGKKVYEKTILFYLYRNYKQYFLLIIIAGLLIPLSSHVGYKDASNQTKYITFNELGKQYVVIQSYGDKYIVSEINIKKKIIKKQFEILDSQYITSKRIKLAYKKIGKQKLM